MYIPHVCFVMHTCKKHATVHTEKWQDMELPCVQSTLDVREFSKNQSFTYMIKIYVPKSENVILKTVFYLHTISYRCQKWPLHCEAFK